MNAKARAPGPAIGRRSSTPVALSSATASGAASASIPNFGLELLGLVFLLQRPEELVELSIHDLRQPVEGEIDAMVGHTALGKVIGADPLGAIAAADLQFS